MSEQQYLQQIRNILDHGVRKPNRTGTDTLSIFGMQSRWDLRNSFPLLTTKRLFWKGIVHELLWFIKGSTNAKELADKKVNIWNANGTKEFLSAKGIEREENDLGPIYGFQWRHFGSKYETMHNDYSGKGVDQLSDVIHKIKINPNDRTIIMSAWNPVDIPQMALPPCHCMCQFYVANGELSCQMYQRSADMGLGVPFNIASYALLTLMIAKVTGLTPGDLVHTLGDAHVYVNHIEQLKIQLERQPRDFPVVKISRDITCIDDFVFEDFILERYNPHGNLDMKMAV